MNVVLTASPITTLSQLARGSFTSEGAFNPSLFQNLPPHYVQNSLGFSALSPEDQKILIRKDDYAAVESVLRKINAAPVFASGILGQALDFLGSSRPPEDLLEAHARKESEFLHPDGRSDWNREAGAVLDQATKMVTNGLARATGLIDELETREGHYGVERLTESTLIPELPLPTDLEEAQALRRQIQTEEDKATQEYRTEQHGRMRDKERKACLRAENRVAEIYREDQRCVADFLAAVRRAGGYPDSTALDRAKGNLDEAVHRSVYLQKQKIGPREFQILHQWRLAHTWKGEAGVGRTLEKQAYAQERDYVVETLVMEVTEMIKKKFPKKDWLKVEELAARAIEIYDRLIEGEDIKHSDRIDLAAIRGYAFPFTIDWNDPDLTPAGSVGRALEQHETARLAFMEVSKNFVASVGPSAHRMVQSAETVAMEREKADFEFQQIRTEEQIERLQDLLRAQGKQISEDHLLHFAAAKKAYEDSFAKYMKFWGPFKDGDDVAGREHTRNKNDKELLYNLAFRLQWALEEIYEIYSKELGEKYRPSCVSFSYNNALRTMEEGVSKGRITSDYIETYFAAVWALAPEAYKEIGLAVPYTGVTLGGRKVLDNTVLDELAAIAGGYYSGQITGASHLIGLKDKVHLVTQVPPHPDVARMAGAKELYRPGFFDHTNLSQQALLIAANHTGITEFLSEIEQGLYGLHNPQQAQEGLLMVPVFGDYVKNRALIIFRNEGSNKANEKIINFLLRRRSLLVYPAGTRIVSPGGSNPFVDYSDPANVLGFRIITDRLTSGQVPKIAQEMGKVAAPGQDFLIATQVHNGNLIVPEPNWFLGQSVIDAILSNLSPKTNLNFQRDVPRMSAYGPLLSSAGFLGVEEWKRQAPDLFRHADGLTYSDREAYIQALQLNSNVISALMRVTAAGMDLVRPQETTEAQKARAKELASLSAEERRRLTEEPLRRHVLERIEKLELRTKELPPNPRKETAKRSLASLDAADAERLERALPSSRADRMLSRFAGLKSEQARAFMREAVQRGASYAQSGRKLALDGDKVLWDHFFEVDPNEIPEMIRREIVDFMTAPSGENVEITENININPFWLAFMMGFREVAGHPPTLFSSTMSSRLEKMAAQVDKNPMAKALFETLLNRDGLSGQEARELLRRGSPYVLTRKQIAEYVKGLMERFAKADYRWDGFTEIEKSDIEAVLLHQADLHFKYRGLFDYDDLVDDRSQNVEQAASYSDAVTVRQPETWTDDKVRLYVAAKVDNEGDTRQRLHQARSGQAMDVIRSLDEERLPVGGLIRFDRRRRPDRVKGLIDEPFKIAYSRRVVHEDYEVLQTDAKKSVTNLHGTLVQKAQEQETKHLKARQELAKLLKNPKTFEEAATIAPKRIENAVQLLWPKSSRKMKPIAGDSDFEMIEWLIRRVPEGNKEIQNKAKALLEDLKDRRFVDLVARLTPKPTSPARVGKKALRALSKNVPQAVNALGTSSLHLIGQSLSAELNVPDFDKNGVTLQEIGEAVKFIAKYCVSRDHRLLTKLGQVLQARPGEKKPKMTNQEMAEAYGIVAERLGSKFAKAAVQKLIDSPDTSPETKTALVESRKELDQSFDEIFRVVRKSFLDAYRFYEAGMVLYQDIKDLKRTICDMPVGPADALVEGFQEFLKGQILSIRKEVENRRQEIGLKNPKFSAENLVYQIVDNLLEEGVRFAGGDETAVGWIFFQARLNLHELGLNESFRTLLNLKDQMVQFQSNKDAKEIAVRIKNGQWDEATGLINAHVGLSKAHDHQNAEEKYRELTMTVWRHLRPEHHERFRQTAQRLFREHFRSNGDGHSQPTKIALDGMSVVETKLTSLP